MSIVRGHSVASLAAAVTLLLFGASPVAADFGKSGWIIYQKAQSAGFRGMPSLSFAPGNLTNAMSNPAFLGMRLDRSLALVSELGFAEDKMGGLLYSEPLGNWAVAGGLFYYDAGSVELNWIEGNELHTESVAAERDLLAIASVGYRLSGQLALGMSVKPAWSQLAERQSAMAYATDLGVVAVPLPGWAVSLALENVGFTSKFLAESAPLPSEAFLGVGYTLQNGSWHFLPTAGAGYDWVDGRWVSEAGIEGGYDFISLNAGYKFYLDEAQINIGVGIAWKYFVLGYAYVPGNVLDATHRLTLGYRFPRPVVAPAPIKPAKKIEQKAKSVVKPKAKSKSRVKTNKSKKKKRKTGKHRAK